MKRTLLLTFAVTSLLASVHAQKRETATTAYAITGTQKGSTSWAQVKLVNINSGEEVQSVYSLKDEPAILNARTGKKIIKKDNKVKNKNKNI